MVPGSDTPLYSSELHVFVKVAYFVVNPVHWQEHHQEQHQGLHQHQEHQEQEYQEQEHQEHQGHQHQEHLVLILVKEDAINLQP